MIVFTSCKSWRSQLEMAFTSNAEKKNNFQLLTSTRVSLTLMAIAYTFCRIQLTMERKPMELRRSVAVIFLLINFGVLLSESVVIGK